jgi:ribonuclease P protein component
VIALEFRSTQSLPRNNRIRKHADFERMFDADSIANKWFVVYAQRNRVGVSRLGVVASKRIMPTAVSRNFAKRLIREVFRRNFLADNTLDVVVRARRQLHPETSTEGRLALKQLLQAVQK